MSFKKQLFRCTATGAVYGLIYGAIVVMVRS